MRRQLGVDDHRRHRETIAAAARSNVSIYAHRSARPDEPRRRHRSASARLPPTGTTRPGVGHRPRGRSRNELRLSQDSLRALAEETGGFAGQPNDFTRRFDRIVRDNSSYYVLAYYPPTDKRDGKFHRIRGPRVARPG